MRPIVVAVVVGNVVNVALNWVLMFGHLGAPRLGAAGSAWSSSIGRWVVLGVLVASAAEALRPHLSPPRADAWRPGAIARTVRLGVPIGVQQLLEVSAFGGATLLMGLFGTVPLAGHEIALNLASLTFMVPLGVATAASVLVGRSVGAGDVESARWHAASALACGVGFMLVSAAAFTLAPRLLAGAYTRDPAVIAAAAALLPIAGAFQLFDGVQAVSSGVLRGSGDTHAPMIANFVGFWLLGIPTGALLAFHAGLGPSGLWWGLVVGLAAVATLLLARVRARLARALSRVDVELPAPATAP
jgi:MATE family multidrug resistance protein